MIKTLLPIALIGCIALNACQHDPFPPRIVEVEMEDTTGISDTTDISDTTGISDTLSNDQSCHPDTVYFQRDVLPLITANCANACHNPDGGNNGVILTDYANIIADGDIRAGDPEGSDLYEMITEDDVDKRMPPAPAAALSAEQIDLIRTWINQGALNNTCDFDSGSTDSADCDPSEVSFDSDITPIFESYGCISCHGGGSVILNNHAGVKTVADNGKLVGAINHQTGFAAMPQGGEKMDSCDIATIEKWVEEGSLDN
ncbi:MAG: c-type cytochrome domain-containing protein [Salibacteraceae bacterium]